MLCAAFLLSLTTIEDRQATSSGYRLCSLLVDFAVLVEFASLVDHEFLRHLMTWSLSSAVYNIDSWFRDHPYGTTILYRRVTFKPDAEQVKILKHFNLPRARLLSKSSINTNVSYYVTLLSSPGNTLCRKRLSLDSGLWSE